jgi:hypothetical protein
MNNIIFLFFNSNLLENFYNLYLEFFPVLFIILKFILVFILLSIGILYILSYKGIYLKIKLLNLEEKENKFTSIRIMIGVSFIILSSGIFFNYLIYLLIWIFGNFNGLLLISLNIIEPFMIDYLSLNFGVFYDIINPLIALGSFAAILQIILTILHFINNKFVLIRPKKSILLIILSVIEVLIFGFECLPYLL